MYIPLPKPDNRVPVCDITVGSALIAKQKVEIEKTIIGKDRFGAPMITLEAWVYLYAPDEKAVDGYGPELPDLPPFSKRMVPLRADNSCGVYFNPKDPADPRNGEIVASQGVQEPAEFIAQLDALDIPATLQGNLYGALMYTPQVIAQLQAGEIARANSAEFNKFAYVLPAPLPEPPSLTSGEVRLTKDQRA
jgi:hypothetical protein